MPRRSSHFSELVGPNFNKFGGYVYIGRSSLLPTDIIIFRHVVSFLNDSASNAIVVENQGQIVHFFHQKLGEEWVETGAPLKSQH